MESAVLSTVLLAITAIWIFESVRAYQARRGRLCGCTHRLKEHVSAWDWDSDFGDPAHVGPNYLKPGTCRRCPCRAFHGDLS